MPAQLRSPPRSAFPPAPAVREALAALDRFAGRRTIASAAGVRMAAETLQNALPGPPRAEVRLRLDGNAFATAGFSRRIRRRLSREIVVEGVHRGDLEVALRQRRDRQPGVAETEVAALLDLASAHLALLMARDDLRATLKDRQRLLAAAPTVVYLTDTGGNFTTRFVSEGVRTLFGYEPEAVLQEPKFWWHRIHPDDRERVRRAVERQVQAGGYNETYRVVRPDGSVRWVRDRAFPIQDRTGRVERMAGLAQDVTELKETESELLRREAVLGAVAFAASQLLIHADWNEAMPEVLRRLGEATAASRVYLFENHRDEQGRLVGSQRHEWTAPGVKPQMDNPRLQGLRREEAGLERWVRLLSRGESLSGPTREFPRAERAHLQAQDIQSILVTPAFVAGSWWGSIGFDDCHTERRWSLTEIDALKATAALIGSIIERSQAETALRRSEAEYRQLFDSAAEGFAIIGTDGTVVTVNAANAGLIGYTPGELVGRLASDFVHSDSMHHFQDLVAGRGIGAGELVEGKLLHRDGHVVWVEGRGTSITYQGKPHRLVVLRDVTERKRAEAAISKAHRALRALSRCNEALIRAASEQELLQSICEVIVATGYRFCWVGYAQHDQNKTVRPVAQAGHDEGYLAQIEVTWRNNERGRGPVGTAIRTCQPVICRNIAEDPRFRPWRAPALARGYASCIALPLACHDEAIGVLAIYGSEVQAFDQEEVRLLANLANNLSYGISAQRDAAQRQRAEQDLLASKQRLENIFNGIEVFLWEEDLSKVWHELEKLRAAGETDLRAYLRRDPHAAQRLAEMVRVNDVNETTLKLLGVQGGVAPLDQIDRFYPPEGMSTFIEELCALWDGKRRLRLETMLETTDGESLVGLLSMRIPQSVDEARHVPVSVVDITERKLAEQKIRYLATFDPLTGLPNRHTFSEYLRQEISRARRQNTRFAVMFLDVDNFKDVNDTLGHAAGDDLLRLIGQRLTASLRGSDTVARFGGDEFAVLLTDVRDPTQAGTVADKILEQIDRPYTIDGNSLYVTTSIGIALLGEEQISAERLMTQADMALYRAKEEGRNTYSFHTEKMDTDIRSRVNLAKELREAIRSGQLYLHYQPQVNLRTGDVVGVEALVRWAHPERGDLQPGVFIPVAEVTGLVAPLGRWVLRRACWQAREWLDAGIDPGVVGVNLSGVQLKATDLEKDILSVLRDTGLPPQYLELELTESILMETSRPQKESLERLHRLGVSFAIDDFGTGYSSLEYLRTFPVNRLKIAQVFVRDLTTDPNDAAIVKATLGLARELGIRVIAEGVETAAQVELLRERGCEEAQGYYFSHPLPASPVVELLRAGRLAPREALDVGGSAASDGARRAG